MSHGLPSNVCTSPPNSPCNIFLHRGHTARINSDVFLSHNETGMEEVQDCSLGGAVADGICIAKAKTSNIASSTNLKAKSPA